MTNIWESEFAALLTVAQWNANVVPWMKARGDEYKRYAHAEAKARGYEFDRDKMEYVHPWKMFSTRGTNLIAVGWRDGILRCIFAGKARSEYYFGGEVNPVPRDTADKLQRSPFPDKLFAQIVKGKYDFKKVA